MRLRRSLRNKILLAMLIGGLVPLMGVAWFFAIVTDGLIQDQRPEDAARSGELARTFIDERGERLLITARAIAVAPSIREAVAAMDRAALVSLPWERLTSARLGDFTIAITDAQGTVLLRSHRPDQWGENFYEEVYGLRAALHGQPGVHTTERAGTRGLALRGFGPIESDGRVVGAVIATQAVDNEFRLSLSQRIHLDTFFASPDGTSTDMALDPTLARSIVGSGQTFNGVASVSGREHVIHAWPVVEPEVLFKATSGSCSRWIIWRRRGHSGIGREC